MGYEEEAKEYIYVGKNAKLMRSYSIQREMWQEKNLKRGGGA